MPASTSSQTLEGMESLTPQSSANDNQEPRRLTEQEKKDNHISSEKKRREAIRAGFDLLADLVPGLQGQARKEGHVLELTNQYLKVQLAERRRLIDQMDQAGIAVPGELRKPLEDFDALQAQSQAEAHAQKNKD